MGEGIIIIVLLPPSVSVSFSLVASVGTFPCIDDRCPSLHDAEVDREGEGGARASLVRGSCEAVTTIVVVVVGEEAKEYGDADAPDEKVRCEKEDNKEERCGEACGRRWGWWVGSWGRVLVAESSMEDDGVRTEAEAPDV